MYEGIKEMVEKMKSNATILRYLETEFCCIWRSVFIIQLFSLNYERQI